MTPEQQVLEILQSWSSDVVVLLRRAGYFSPSMSDVAKEEIATKIGFGKGTRLYRQLAKMSEAKNWEVAKIVLTEENLIELKQGARQVAKELGVPFSAYDWNPIAQSYLKKEGFQLVKTLTGTDLKRLEKQMQAHFGLNERAFERRFRENYPCSPYRTRTIFRTEKNNALNGGGYLEAKSVDAKKKIWRHSHGPNPRKDHLAMDGEVRDIDDPFSNGKQYPNGDPNCRCRADYKF